MAFALKSGLPAPGARALPDGEIVAGTPIPATIPLPGKAMPAMPVGKVSVVPKYQLDLGGGAIAPIASMNHVEWELDGEGNPIKGNPGYPFWTAGMTDDPAIGEGAEG